MKVGIATTLSIAGVLAAGAAAFAVNTSVLSASPSASTYAIASEGLATTQANVAPASTAPLVKQASISSTPVTGKVTTYQVGTSGSVVIDMTSGAIVVTNVIPAAGWTSEPARTNSNGDVKVHFISGENRIEFIARMVNGSVAVDVKVEKMPSALASLAPVPGAPAPVVKPAYRDDDDHEEREHDDDDKREEREEREDEEEEDDD